MSQPKKFCQSVLEFNKNLNLNGYRLPQGISALNPFQGTNRKIIESVTKRFYEKFYNDDKERKAILGINPGRFGAGITGIPFTDTKRLNVDCGILMDQFTSHEPSSVFIYEVIGAYGGVSEFYGDYFINSLCPIGFVIEKRNGKVINYNFYDDRNLEQIITPFIVQSLKKQIEFGLRTDRVVLLGTGKNYRYFQKLNQEYRFFDEVVPVEHPRYIMQYKHKTKSDYIKKYLKVLKHDL